MRGKELHTNQVLHSDVSSGSRVGKEKAGVTGKSYSLERKVLSTRVVCERDAKWTNKGERGRCSSGMSTICQRRKKGLTQELHHKERMYCIS
jgi:hypothetical protein